MPSPVQPTSVNVSSQATIHTVEFPGVGSSPYDTIRSAATVISTIFPFLKLPREIRNSIYVYHIRSHLRIRPFRDHLSLDLKKHLEAGSREPRHGFPSILIVSAQITREVTPLLSELTLNINECVSPFAITNALGLRYLLRLRHVSFDIKIVEDNDCQHLQDWTHLVQTLTHIWSGRHNLKSLTISCEQLYWTDAICHLVGECLEDLQGFLWGFQPLKGIDHVSIKLKGGAYGKLPEELIVGLKEAMAGEEIERFDVLTKFSSR